MIHVCIAGKWMDRWRSGEFMWLKTPRSRTPLTPTPIPREVACLPAYLVYIAILTTSMLVHGKVQAIPIRHQNPQALLNPTSFCIPELKWQMLSVAPTERTLRPTMATIQLSSTSRMRYPALGAYSGLRELDRLFRCWWLVPVELRLLTFGHLRSTMPLNPS